MVGPTCKFLLLLGLASLATICWCLFRDYNHLVSFFDVTYRLMELADDSSCSLLQAALASWGTLKTMQGLQVKIQLTRLQKDIEAQNRTIRVKMLDDVIKVHHDVTGDKAVKGEELSSPEAHTPTQLLDMSMLAMYTHIQSSPSDMRCWREADRRLLQLALDLYRLPLDRTWLVTLHLDGHRFDPDFRPLRQEEFSIPRRIVVPLDMPRAWCMKALDFTKAFLTLLFGLQQATANWEDPPDGVHPDMSRIPVANASGLIQLTPASFLPVSVEVVFLLRVMASRGPPQRASFVVSLEDLPDLLVKYHVGLGILIWGMPLAIGIVCLLKIRNNMAR